MGFKDSMSALGKGLSDWAENADPIELKLSNIGKPVEVVTYLRNDNGGVVPDTRVVRTGVLESYMIGRDGMTISLIGLPKVVVTRKEYRVEVRVA